MNADDMPIANQKSLNQEDCSKQGNKGDLYSQNGNFGISHMSGGEIKDEAKIAGKIEENNNSHNTNIQVNVSLDPQTEPKSSQKPLNKSQNKKVSFEIRISGELTNDEKEEYKDIKKETEDIVKKLNQYFIKTRIEMKEQINYVLMSKLYELEENMDLVDDEFNDMIEAQSLEINKIKNPKLKQAKNKDLNEAIDRFIETKDELLTRFKAIIYEGLK